MTQKDFVLRCLTEALVLKIEMVLSIPKDP